LCVDYRQLVQHSYWSACRSKPTFMKTLKPFHNTIGNSVRRLLYIVRNPLDVIHLRSIGILNVVANMFDSLTIEQVRLIGSGIPTRIDKVAFLYSDIDELTRNDLSAIAFTHWVSLFIHHDNKPIRKWTLEEMVI